MNKNCLLMVKKKQNKKTQEVWPLIFSVSEIWDME